MNEIISFAWKSMEMEITTLSKISQLWTHFMFFPYMKDLGEKLWLSETISKYISKWIASQILLNQKEWINEDVNYCNYLAPLRTEFFHCMAVNVSPWACGCQRATWRSQASRPTRWVPGIKLKLSGLAVSIFAHCAILPAPIYYSYYLNLYKKEKWKWRQLDIYCEPGWTFMNIQHWM